MADTTSPSETSTAAPLPPFTRDPATGPEPAVHETLPAGRQRRRILALGVVVALLAVAGMAAWLLHVVTTARALQAVTSSVTLPAAVPPAPPVAPAAALVPTQAMAAAADLPATAAPIAAVAAPAPPETPQPTAGAGAAKPDKTKGAVKAKARKGREAAKRQARKAARAGGTFARCPALGKPGAVMCRWHVCNGAAGKEAVCRPYLERRP